jgi:exodeoxyribonuclease V alpha subunit
MEIKTGVLTEIIFHNEENGYTIAEMETDDELLTVVGSLPSAAKGTCLQLTGDFKLHPKYGEQFAFTEAVEKLPESKMGIEGFLASGAIRGIGPKMAGAIVHVFGEDTFRIFEEDPDQLLKIPGIGRKKMQMILESYREHREFADISVYFQNYGVSAGQALKLYKAYGREAVTLMTENPYRLVDELYGFGFRKADEIAMKLGLAADSPYRIDSGIKYTLEYMAGDGSTYLPEQMLLEEVSQLLDLTREQIAERVTEMALEGTLQMDRIEEERVVYQYIYYMAEQRVCSNLAVLRNADLKTLSVDIDRTIRFTEESSGIPFSEKQKLAIRSCLTQGVSVITGGPGTGKTTIINAVINILEESDLKVAIAAPTGRASKRITETSGHFAQTIHRLLEYYFSEDTKEMSFGMNREDPLDYDAVIVDEASMVDLLLMKALTDALRPGTRLILVGDSDQLPSVGAGNVLRDLIESGYVSVARLTEIYRQGQESMIVMNAHRINHGEYPVVNGKGTDFFFMDRGSEVDMQSLVAELVTRRLPAYYADVDPLAGIQVLTPTKKGKIGTRELNTLLQEKLNPAGPGIPEKAHRGRIFRSGDKVMQIKNNYQIEWRIPGDPEGGQGVFNGDVGFIQDISAEDGTLTVLFDEERFVQYDFSQLDELELAYAVTVHKSQGSEFPVMVMPVSWLPPMLATRNLLYTAVTRGKRAVVLVGVRDRMHAMIDNDRIRLRYSGLRSRLEKMMEFDE